jgi:hypothetical protein
VLAGAPIFEKLPIDSSEGVPSVPDTSVTTAALGRKLLPKDDPSGPVERFAWLIRSMRACHPDPAIRDTSEFSKVLKMLPSEDLKPATINRLETGSLDFTLERCISYERALGLKQDSLADSYIWTMRNSGRIPKTRLMRLQQPQAEDMDLFYGLGKQQHLRPLQWIRLSHLYRNRPDLFSSGLREELFEGVLAALAGSAEGKQRLIREALINIGDDIAPVIVNYVKRQPIRHFVAVEALGYMTGSPSWRGLLELQEVLLDSWTIHSIIESIQRRLVADSKLRAESDNETRLLTTHAVSALRQPEELFMAREACLGLARRPTARLSLSQRASLDSVREDLVQLDVTPTTLAANDLVEVVLRSFTTDMLERRVSESIPASLPGLSRMVRDAIFSKSRQDRIALGVLLSPWGQASSLTRAIGDTLFVVPDEDYGIQRSMVRFATKLGSNNFQPYVRKLATADVKDDGIGLSVAWALGMGRGNHEADADLLRRMYRCAHSRNTKRAICTASSRRGFSSLLKQMAEDRDSIVSQEARVALSRQT